ncbi:GatB/YqeY domain-containing protein [Limnobacter humi]|uniref:GatB/YqeY domain-containing protein n=1 Tax=Limnobacter humi TaxID=1778671 RepID=A0ABT1WHI3_9BURK|nr:GatB/YqeY domain-containing protein [Limnobacter humi]MCQ8896966.1 GatB/YqeY domain-containing protein [Limnobacter humi]
MSLKAQILEDIKQAMKAREQAKLATLRMLSAAIKQKEVDERVDLDDGAVLAIIEKQIKQRNEAAVQFEQGGRLESAAAEKAEAAVLAGYLPAQLSDDEILSVVREVVAAVGAAGPQDMGKVMGQAKPRLAGKADMSKVSALIKQVLSAL